MDEKSESYIQEIVSMIKKLWNLDEMEDWPRLKTEKNM